ncbi:MAG: phospholipase, partial [Actinomyces sp.]|nr:phospholipase [Actinomyces sp.]
MVRILFIVAWFAASIYAISDWATTPADRMPMKLSRMTWLVIL